MRLPAAACLLFGVLAASPPARAEPFSPPVWEVSDGDTDIQLIAVPYSVEASLGSGDEWRLFLERVIGSDELVVATADDDPAMTDLVGSVTLWIDPRRPLSSRLNPDLRDLVARAAAAAGLQGADLEPFTPVGAAAILVGALDQRYGRYSVEATFIEAAEDRAIAVVGLTDAREVVAAFRDMPEPAAQAMLRLAADTAVGYPAPLAARDAAWARGDLPALQALEVQPIVQASPVLFDLGYVKPASHYADQLAMRMLIPGRRTAVLDLGYMVGQHGVPALLKAKGFSLRYLGGGPGGSGAGGPAAD